MFLSFLNGRRTGAIFKIGVHDNEVKWRDFSIVNIIHDHKAVQSFISAGMTLDLNRLWNEFLNIAKDSIDIDFLESVIHWYSESNSSSSLLEGSIIMIQTALELIFNWLCVEKKNLLTSSDVIKISANSKIGMTLSVIGLSTRIPENFRSLISLNKKDAVDALVWDKKCNCSWKRG